jgi:hypothetical protein
MDNNRELQLLVCKYENEDNKSSIWISEMALQLKDALLSGRNPFSWLRKTNHSKTLLTEIIWLSFYVKIISLFP